MTSPSADPVARLARLFAAALAIAALAAGCATRPATRTGPASVWVVCPASGDPVQCFAPASALCGREGYDLFDLRGRRATVGDARFGALQARCRERRPPGR